MMRLLFVVCLFLVASLTLLSCDRAPESFVASYWFESRLAAAEVVSGRRIVGTAPYTIGGVTRHCLAQEPPSVVRFPDVPAGEGARLHLGPAMAPESWDNVGDGVRFQVRCRTDDGWLGLLDQSLDPVDNAADRAWMDREIDLDRCAGPRTTIELSTGCGPQENCAADWAAWCEPHVRYPRKARVRPERIAILISVDTLRADRMSIYGATRATTPNLDALARDSVTFDSAIAPTSWTIPSHATMLTSTHPSVHRADTQNGIPESIPNLAEVLSAHGWQAMGVADTGFLRADRGFGRGFSRYDYETPVSGRTRHGARQNFERVIDQLAATDRRPAFVFWHIMDVHAPYEPWPPFAGRFAGDGVRSPVQATLGWMQGFGYHDYLELERYGSFQEVVDSYDEGLLAVDAVLGELFAYLRAAGAYEDALIVVTSDHGESFGDHGVYFGHGLTLTEVELRVPLIVKLPGNRFGGERVTEMVRLLDVAPTVLEALAVDAPTTFQGQSLLAAAAGDRSALPSVAFGYSVNAGERYVRTNRHKYIDGRDSTAADAFEIHLRPRGSQALPAYLGMEERFYDLGADPGEQTPSLADAAGRLEALRAQLQRHREESERRAAAGGDAEAAEISDADKELLRALGYELE